MDNWFALFAAIGSNTVGLLTGVLGLLATICSLIFKETAYSKWLMRAGIVAFILSPSLAWIDEHKIRMELEKTRPYVLIEGVPAETIRAYAVQNPQGRMIPEAAWLPGWVTGNAPDGEIFMYNITNGEKITARGLQHFCRITVIDPLGLETDMRLPKQPNDWGVLVPKQSITRRLLVPHGTFYQEGRSRLALRMVLAVTYLGQPSDETRYFYRVVLKTQQHIVSPETVGMELGNFIAESSNDGIFTKVDDLLR